MNTDRLAQRSAFVAMVGGFGEEREMIEEVALMVAALKEDIEVQAGETFETFDPISYKSQVVAGINYDVTVRTGDEKSVVVRIFKPLPHTGEPPKVTSVTLS